MLPRLCIVGLSGVRRGTGESMPEDDRFDGGEMGEVTLLVGVFAIAVSTMSTDFGRMLSFLVTVRRRLLIDVEGRAVFAFWRICYVSTVR